jgi:hypothetical protein
MSEQTTYSPELELSPPPVSPNEVEEYIAPQKRVRRRRTVKTAALEPPHRTLEQLENVSFEHMSFDELLTVARQQYEDLCLARHATQGYRESIENGFKEIAYCKDRIQTVQRAAAQQIQYLRDSIAMLYRTTTQIALPKELETQCH